LDEERKKQAQSTTNNRTEKDGHIGKNFIFPLENLVKITNTQLANVCTIV
jgi:hypothetical protein